MVRLCDQESVRRDFFSCIRGTAVGCQMEMALSVYEDRDPQTNAWTVYSEKGAACGGIVFSAGSLFVCLREEEGAAECAEFLQFLFPGHSFHCDGKTPELLKPYGFCVVDSGEELCLSRLSEKVLIPGEYEFSRETRSDSLYALLCQCFERFRKSQQREAFVADLFLKRRQGAKILSLSKNENLCATAGIYAVGKESSLLSAVATLPEHRGKGLAGFLVSQICEEEFLQERKVFVMTEEEYLSRFYERIGFTRNGRWAILKEKENQ